jgi:hypothetical protein
VRLSATEHAHCAVLCVPERWLGIGWRSSMLGPCPGLPYALQKFTLSAKSYKKISHFNPIRGNVYFFLKRSIWKIFNLSPALFRPDLPMHVKKNPIHLVIQSFNMLYTNYHKLLDHVPYKVLQGNYNKIILSKYLTVNWNFSTATEKVCIRSTLSSSFWMQYKTSKNTYNRLSEKQRWARKFF